MNSIIEFSHTNLHNSIAGIRKGGVRQRGLTWSYYFDLGMVEGKRKKKEKGGFRTKVESEKALRKAMAEYDNAGSIIDQSNITVSDCRMSSKIDPHLR